ncbi:MAG: T9SS type A sorting domain-containing protein [Bacteroidetes bacterium]|nr:T9SS type A sorting domain-containing protein [Bacteroidota bacterium]
MKHIYTVPLKAVCLLISTVSMLLCVINPVKAQPATVAIPVAIGRPCGGSSTKDSVKYFNYSASTNTLTHRSLCKPSLASPGFSSSLATITYNSYDGYLYFMQIALTGGHYNTSAYRWLPTGCPTGSQAVYKTFTNQFVAGVEFDPSTGLGYQLNFVDTTGWAPNAIDQTGTVGQYASHAMVNGNPAVAYYDGTNKRLKFIRADENNGSSWTSAAVVVSATGDVGKYASLLVVDGNPAIAYYDGLAGKLNLMYVRANDADGTSWGTPVVVESTNDVGQYASLAIVNGNPAIAYYDNTNGDLRYIRATNIDGTAWGTPVAVETINNVGWYASLAVVNGNPAIAFYDVTNGDLRYTRANDANGTSWAAGMAVQTTNNIGQYASLLVVNGNPAISYYDVSNTDLRYISATDANGTTWGTSVNISSSGTVGQYTSMAIVDGNPGISYYDATNKDLKFVRANDAGGTAWATPVSVETTNDVGQYSSLIIDNGNPSIAYYDATNGDLRFIRAYDADGTLWYKNSSVYNMELQQVNFTTGILGNSYPLDFGGRHIYLQNGDVVMTPSQQLLAIFDNKYFTVNWQAYGTATPLVATYIDTIMLGTGNNLVGLAYSDGKLVAAISPSSGCYSYKQIDILTGAQSAVTYSAGATIFGSADMTDITSGIGAAKKLVSATENPVGSGTYDIVYDVFIKNYGGTPVTNVQAYDTLYQINGLVNLISGSIVSVTGPAGFNANPSFNGKTVFTLFNTPLATLSNIPGQNTVTIRVTAKVSNIVKGVVYYNQAYVTGNGLFGDALKDASTDGSNPDLNNNSKPDDASESQPTPFLVSVTAQTPPCSSLTNVLYTQNFGSGTTGLSTTIPAPTLGTGVTLPVGTSLYTGSASAPIAEETYAVANNANLANSTKYVNLTDHTGGPINPGRFLIVNADANTNVLYKGGFTYSLCPNQQYSLSFYAAFLGNNTYHTQCDALGGFVYSKIKMNIKDGATGLIITQVSTSDITSNSWQQFGLKFISPASYTSIIIELVNDQVGGCGNVLGIDDVQFGSCDAMPVVNSSFSYGCIGNSVSFTSSLSDPTALPGTKDYQWQVATSASGPWINIIGATSANYTIASTTVADTGKYYRVLVAATGNIGMPNCQYASPGLYLPGVMPSTAPSGVSASAATICASSSSTLTATGGVLGTGANYQWGTGSTIGSNPIVGATSSTLIVTPGSTTTYWVQIQNTNAACAPANSGVTTVVTVNQPSTAPTSVTGADVCAGTATTLTAVGGALGTGANYQWGTGSVVGTNPIAGATSATYTVSPATTTTYWVRIQNNSAPCTATTSGVTKTITVSQPSVAATSATRNKNNICAGISVNLGITGGTLGTSASWKWYTGSPGGTLVGTGASISVTPAVTTTYYVRAEGTCNTTAAQSVTVFISCNIDKDQDGIPDWVESNMSAAFADANANGVINAYDPTYAGFVDNNNDYINDNFQADGDSDNDGIPNYLDTDFPGRIDSNSDGVDDRFDNDLDGVINMLDLDSDNDGIPDVVEAGGVDTDGNGKIDNFSDTDNDGLSQNVDVNNTGAYNTGLGLGKKDTDGDGVPNYLDLDSDNDGIPDVREVLGPDTNNDGKADGFVDANGDGLNDNYINGTALLKTGADINSDGKADSYPNKNLDQDPYPNAYDIDSDGDGIVDVIEAGLPDANLDGKVDGVLGTNGWSTTVSAMAALTLRNTDGAGNPDFLDIDSDDDGIPDNIEGQSTAGYKLPVTTDTDGDGLVNTYDNVVGFGGSGIFVWDQDGDGIPDYRDLDTDADGQPDIVEGNDFNLNGIADDVVTLTGLDTDGDGLDNRFDSLNSTTNLKGTSYMMGNSGSLTGDPAPGTRSPVQKKTAMQSDRDWRFTSSVLPIQFLTFTGNAQALNVLLNWTIITPNDVDHFEVERSTDNSTYTKVGTVSDKVKLNEAQSFSYLDDISGVSAEIIYYRLKVIGANGEIKYSNVLVVRRNLTKTPVSLMPNPASEYVNVKFFAEKESEVTIRLMDNLGKLALVQKQKVLKGNNVLQLIGLTKYSAGVYIVQIFVNDEVITQKLIIGKQ